MLAYGSRLLISGLTMGKDHREGDIMMRHGECVIPSIQVGRLFTYNRPILMSRVRG